jgi:geranylgeranyl pyrophosphate synthase
MNISQLRELINQSLNTNISQNCQAIIEIDAQLIPVAESLRYYLSEGKRFRPLFALLGYLGANGEITEETIKAVSSLEYLQASALIHDDLMDGSDTRRGKPAIHKQFEALHGKSFGSSAAILIGDLALVWNEQTALATPKNLETYLEIFSDYGLPLGEAFQLRDDLLGVFGDPKETGKPAGDDLREGKRTALIAYAYERGDVTVQKLLDQKLGSDLTTAEVIELQEAITETGAVIHIEDLIEKLSESASDAINRNELNNSAKPLLEEMISLVTKRSR